VPSWHSSLPQNRPGVWAGADQQTCMRYMGLEKACATIVGKLGRPKAMSFMPYRCTLSLLFVVPKTLNLSHVAPVQQQSTCHRACSTHSSCCHRAKHMAAQDEAHLSLVPNQHNHNRQMHDNSCESAVIVMGSNQAEVCSIAMGRPSERASEFAELTSYAVDVQRH